MSWIVFGAEIQHNYDYPSNFFDVWFIFINENIPKGIINDNQISNDTYNTKIFHSITFEQEFLPKDGKRVSKVSPLAPF